VLFCHGYSRWSACRFPAVLIWRHLRSHALCRHDALHPNRCDRLGLALIIGVLLAAGISRRSGRFIAFDPGAATENGQAPGSPWLPGRVTVQQAIYAVSGA
jgi:hypothetical protein